MDALTTTDAEAMSFADLARTIRPLIEKCRLDGVVPSKNELDSLVTILKTKIQSLPQKPDTLKQLDPPSIPAEPPNAAPQYTPSALYKQVRENFKFSMKHLQEERSKSTGQQKGLLKIKLNELKIVCEKRLQEIKLTELGPEIVSRWSDQKAKHAEWQRAKSSALSKHASVLPKLKKKLAPLVESWNRQNEILKSTRDRQFKIWTHLSRDCEELFNHSPSSDFIRLPWTILPPSELPAQNLVNALRVLRDYKRRNPTAVVDERRVEFAYRLVPQKVYIGTDEFDGYFVFVFGEGNRVLLEHPIEGNAAYIFGQNWKELSKLSKSELLGKHRHELRRIIHKHSWEFEISQALGEPWYSQFLRGLFT